MKGFQYSVFVLAVVVLSAQTAHYLYMKYLYPKRSVLDTQVDTQIKAADSLDGLVNQLKESDAEVEAYENSLGPEELRDSYRRDIEPYETNDRLKEAIRDWEYKREQMARLLFQWTFGLVLVAAGTGLSWRKSSWPGCALIVAGLAEMLWWSSPSIALSGAVGEFERILNVKLLLTLITATVFAGVWYVWRRANSADA